MGKYIYIFWFFCICFLLYKLIDSVTLKKHNGVLYCTVAKVPSEITSLNYSKKNHTNKQKGRKNKKKKNKDVKSCVAGYVSITTRETVVMYNSTTQHEIYKGELKIKTDAKYYYVTEKKRTKIIQKKL